MYRLAKPLTRLLRLHAGVLLLSGCSSADMCEPGDPCVSFSYTSYRSVLNSACAAACAQLTECGGTLAKKPDGDCEQACRSEIAQDYYWTCEPRYRALLDCLAERHDCEGSSCTSEAESFTACRTDDLPANANSCVLANNGACDEPRGCVVGSDTTDCRGER